MTLLNCFAQPNRCKRGSKVLCYFVRLWRAQLEQFRPFWSLAGVHPVRGRKDGETWKQLVSTALGETWIEPPDCSAEKAKEFWDKGQILVLMM